MINTQRLVSSSQAAKLLNLSVQGIHYRIKNGQLKAIKENGKILVYIDDSMIEVKEQQNTTNDGLLSAKDEQILLLKKSLKWMRKQYGSEIQRLEKNQAKIISVFQSEISLLQGAFNEMRKVYQIQDKPNSTTSSAPQNNDFSLMNIQEFFSFMKQHSKSDSQIKSMILEKVKQGDKRFIYDKATKDVIIYRSDFLDLI
jgi:hypothetical protein